MYELRPYQAEAKNAILSQWDQGFRRTLLVLPTGTGKTIVFDSVAQHQVENGHRVLIMAHRGELLTQAADKLKKACGLDSVLEKADSSALGSDIPVTVGSVQSLGQPKRLEAFPNDYYDDIIVDEAHHCLSSTYQRVLEHFPNANVLGVTATPDRGDMRNLGNYFDSKAYEYTMAEAVHDGYLCPILAQMIPLQLDMKTVRTTEGDYNAGDLGSALAPYLEQIAGEMVNYCQGRKTVVFLPLIATSQAFCKMLQEHGFRAAEVNGNSPDRTEILEDFEAGKYDVLCNSMLLTEGWDCPSVDCVVVLRPTKIRSLYQQMVGRGMRLADGKKNLLLLDFLWMTTKHDLCRPSSLISKDANVAERIDKMIQANDEGIDLVEAENIAMKDIRKEREDALAAQLHEQSTRQRKTVDPITFALSIEDDDLADYYPTFAWEMEPATEKQLKALANMGIDPSSVENKGYASMLMNRLIGRSKAKLATPAQIRVLKQKGFRNCGNWSKEQASKMMSQLANNHWKIPHGIDPMTYVPR